MTEKQLKKLSRSELLEMLLEQTKESERLREELEVVKAELEERQLKVQEAGDLAHAVVAVNKLLETAQATADQYLENIARMEQEARAKYERTADEV